MKIVKLHNLDTDHINIYNPEKINENMHIFNIKYFKKKLITQTPKAIVEAVPIMYSCSKYYRLNISFQDFSFNNKTKAFINSIVKIENTIKQYLPYLWKKIDYNHKNTVFIPSITYNKENTKAIFNLNIQNDNGTPSISIFDFDNTERSFEYLKLNSSTLNLIMLNNIWQKSNKIGLNWILLQTKIYEPFIKIDKCLIMDEDDDEILI